MAEYVFGASILENLTTGMYKDSQIIFREYIQNSCDAIDAAISQGILNPEEGLINIWTDDAASKRTILIEDNGTGIAAKDFESTLSTIAQSTKQLDTQKGFRGIGRLCGLAYCKELIFSTTAKNENIISVMKIDAKKLCNRFYSKKKYSAQNVLDDVITIEQKIDDTVTTAHWFKVELIHINLENDILLDEKIIRDYLSFVAPVEYRNTFLILSQKIYAHAAELNCKIDEYKIHLNGEQIVKNYHYEFDTSRGSDVIFDVEFRDFYDKAGNLLAWAWIGLSKFKGIIGENKKSKGKKSKKDNLHKPYKDMRSIRLRKGNIQIGDENALQSLFDEERGTHYFIGEVFAVDSNLIPNARRDYFIENATFNELKKGLQRFFKKLHKVYYTASNLNSALRNIENAKQAEENFNAQDFESPEQKAVEKEKLAEMVKLADKSQNKITRQFDEAKFYPNEILSRVALRILEKADDAAVTSQNIDTRENNSLSAKIVNKPFENLSRRERGLVNKILAVVRDNTDARTFEKIQSGIVEAVS